MCVCLCFVTMLRVSEYSFIKRHSFGLFKDFCHIIIFPDVKHFDNKKIYEI